MKATTTLHYIYDPLCGWCYGAAPLVDAAQTVPDLSIALHAGGMLTGSNRRKIDAHWREHVVKSDTRIAAMTGQLFGDAYINGLLLDTSAIMDSAPPTSAILAAENLAGAGLAMLHRIQIAHYQHGLRVADLSVLEKLAADMALDAEAFNEEMKTVNNGALQTHITQSRMLLARVNGSGFPTFVLEDRHGKYHVLQAGHYLGNADAWKRTLQDFVTAK